MVIFFMLLCLFAIFVTVFWIIQFNKIRENERIKAELERINSLKGLEKVKYKIKNVFKKQKMPELKPIKYTKNQLKKYITTSVMTIMISFIGIGIGTIVPTFINTYSNNTYIAKNYGDRNKENEIEHEEKNENDFEEKQNIQDTDFEKSDKTNENEVHTDTHNDEETKNDTKKEDQIEIEENNTKIQEADNKSNIENEKDEQETKNIEKNQKDSSGSNNNEKSSANVNTNKKPSSNSQSTSSSASTNKDISSSYVLNTNTKKFHYPSCGSVKQISEKNKQEYEGSRNDLISKGYAPCKRCNP
ncbi:MAG TPA: hypothetical protein DEP51_01660 [Clostridiales bacterium]|nr:hypothetical protein [Clostridiales bacterium]